jgi:hypothetical protein
MFQNGAFLAHSPKLLWMAPHFVVFLFTHMSVRGEEGAHRHRFERGWIVGTTCLATYRLSPAEVLIMLSEGVILPLINLACGSLLCSYGLLYAYLWRMWSEIRALPHLKLKVWRQTCDRARINLWFRPHDFKPYTVYICTKTVVSITRSSQNSAWGATSFENFLSPASSFLGFSSDYYIPCITYSTWPMN